MISRKKCSFALITAFVLSFLAFNPGINPALAQGIIPKPEGSCDEFDIKSKSMNAEKVEYFNNPAKFKEGVAKDRSLLRTILGCAVRVGKVRLFMIPFFITYLIQFLLTIAGLIAILFVVVGGYKYVIGGLTEDKEAGKKSIIRALIGLAVALSAWIVVNLVQIALTS